MLRTPHRHSALDHSQQALVEPVALSTLGSHLCYQQDSWQERQGRGQFPLYKHQRFWWLE